MIRKLHSKKYLKKIKGYSHLIFKGKEVQY